MVTLAAVSTAVAAVALHVHVVPDAVAVVALNNVVVVDVASIRIFCVPTAPNQLSSDRHT